MLSGRDPLCTLQQRSRIIHMRNYRVGAFHTLLVACQRSAGDSLVQVIQADEHSICMLLRTPASQQAAAGVEEGQMQGAEEEGRQDEAAGLPTAAQPLPRTSKRERDVYDQQWDWLTGPPLGNGKCDHPFAPLQRCCGASITCLLLSSVSLIGWWCVERWWLCRWSLNIIWCCCSAMVCACAGGLRTLLMIWRCWLATSLCWHPIGSSNMVVCLA